MKPRLWMMLLGLLGLTLACATPAQLPMVTSSPPPTPLSTPKPSPLPQPPPTPSPSVSAWPTFPPYDPDDLNAHYQAMRPGFEEDVDALANRTRYWLMLDLNLDPVRIWGVERIRFTNHTPDTLSSLVLRLYPNHLAGYSILQVYDITIDGVPVEGEHDVADTVLRVPLPDRLAPDEMVEAELTFTMTLPSEGPLGWGQIGNVGDTTVMASFFPMLSVYEEGAWWETEPSLMGDPVYSETALFDVWLYAPSDTSVATTGVLIGTESDNEATLYHFATGPVRDFALGISSEFELLSEEVDGITVNVWSAPGDNEDDRRVLDMTELALSFFNEQFWPYPFTEFDVLETRIDAAGIEYPGLIYLTSFGWGDDDPFTEWLIVHETAHQWWYSVVGNDQVGEPWLDEGLTEYSVELYFYHIHGEHEGELAHQQFQSEVENYVSRHGGVRLPIGMPTDAYPGLAEYSTFVYSGGALLLDTLAEQYGRDAVQLLLQTYFQDFRYGVAHSEDLEALVREQLGEEAQALFREWVYGDPQEEVTPTP